MNRDEYLVRAREMAPRGERLPQTKLTRDEAEEIRRLARLREVARAQITQELSNTALARRFNVSARAVERVLAYEVHVGL
jgi:transcriptional regulator GlxA family with amidase domain